MPAVYKRVLQTKDVMLVLGIVRLVELHDANRRRGQLLLERINGENMLVRFGAGLTISSIVISIMLCW